MRAAVVAVLVLAGCERVPAARTAADPPPKAAKEKPVASAPPTRRSTPGPKPAPQRPSFEAAWAEAEEMGRKLDGLEPADTREALAALTEAGRDAAEELMRDDLDVAARPLIRLGLSAWVARQGRRASAGDGRLKATARVLWDGSGPGPLLRLMNVWGALDPSVRNDVHGHAARGTPPADLPADVRDAVRAVGAGWWLDRR